MGWGGQSDCGAGHMHGTVHGALFGHPMCIYWVVWWDGAAYVYVTMYIEQDTGRTFRHLVYCPEEEQHSYSGL